MDEPIQDLRRGTVQERVARRLPAEFTDECWVWPGKVNGNGYAVIRRGPKADGHVKVTRIVYELFHGPVPDGCYQVLHSCDNPPCVNPQHLRAGTDADNVRDKMLKGRATMVLTPDEVRAIRSDPRGSTTVARDYGVSKQTVQKIRRGDTWVWLV